MPKQPRHPFLKQRAGIRELILNPLLFAGFFACAGTVEPAVEPASGAPKPGPPASAPQPAPITMPRKPAGPQPVARLHKLTAREFSASLKDILGADILLSGLEADQQIDGLYSVGASELSISPAGISRFEGAVQGAVENTLSDAAKAKKLLACVPTQAMDTACLAKAMNALGRRAFRRPLLPAETNRYVTVAQSIGTEANDPLLGLRFGISALLQSPNFLYRSEVGTPSPGDGGRHKYSGYEMASRLAAILWGSVPDDPLLDAAAQDSLATETGVRKQGERLLAHANARRALGNFASDLYGTEHLENAFKDTNIFKTWTPSMRESMRDDLLARVADLAFGTPGDYLTLFDSRTVFVNNELGKLYSVAAAMPDSMRKVDLPDTSPRRGLLGSGAILAGYALPQRTSPTQRGRFIAESLLCKTVPLPPPGVDTNLDETSDPKASLREQLDKHRANPQCASCHALMDPLGLGLENFDAIGNYRTTDKGKTIDTSGMLDGMVFRNGGELGERLRQHPQAGPCFVRKLYAHAQGRLPLDVDEPGLDVLAKQFFQGGNRAQQLLLDLVSHEAFRFVEPAAP